MGWGERNSGAATGLAVGANGDLYVLRGTDMRVYDKTGKYLRTIMPYSAKTPKERTAPVGHIEAGGEHIPMVFNAQALTTYPMTTGLRARKA